MGLSTARPVRRMKTKSASDTEIEVSEFEFLSLTHFYLSISHLPWSV